MTDTVDLEARRGDSESYALALTIGGDPIDLSELAGDDVRFTAKYRAADTDEEAVILKDLEDGIEVTSAVDGEAVVRVTAADTGDLPAATVLLFYDVQVRVTIDEVEQIKTPLSGRFTVRPDITHGDAGS